MPRTSSDRALSAETRATKMAAEDMEKVREAFKGAPRFMDQPRSVETQRIHDLIARSPKAKELINAGFTQGFAERVARLERDEEPADPLQRLVK